MIFKINYIFRDDLQMLGLFKADLTIWNSKLIKTINSVKQSFSVKKLRLKFVKLLNLKTVSHLSLSLSLSNVFVDTYFKLKDNPI